MPRRDVFGDGWSQGYQAALDDLLGAYRRDGMLGALTWLTTHTTTDPTTTTTTTTDPKDDQP